jgi:hypothetical protein
MAPCPICSPTFAKYEIGHLIWSPITGLLHAVGHCCGHKFFLNDTYAKGIYDAKRRATRIADEKFLERNWTAPQQFQDHAQAIAPQARAYDQFTRGLRSSLTDAVARSIYRGVGAGGHLTVVEYVTPADGTGGAVKAIERPFGAAPFRGQSIFRAGRKVVSAEGRLRQAIVPFEQLDWKGLDDALWWLSSASSEDLRKLARWLSLAAESVSIIHKDLQAAKSFLDPRNVELLNSWLAETRPRDLGIALRSHSTLAVWRREHSPRKLVVPHGIWTELPEPPELEGG